MRACVRASDNVEIVIIVQSNPSAKEEEGDVIITTDTGATLTLEDGFAYTDESAIAKVEPDNGQIGTVVTITGSDLRGNGENITTVSMNCQ